MKNLVIKNPAIIVGAWFAIIFAVASILTSCGNGHVMCDAYGDSGENHELFKDEV
jgi:hypothetical protein|tara:strand:+ start:19 stop:183 length:165 start_codon:yes stop_codon:yes gene_type:complete